MARLVPALVLVGWLSACACGGEPTRTTSPARKVETSAAVDQANMLVGVVETPDGAPANDAVVAVNGVKGEPFAIVRVDASGRFRVPRPQERFAVTATSALGSAVFVPPSSTTETIAPRLQLRLHRATEAFTIEGNVTLRSQSLPPGTFLRASRVSDDEGDIFYTSLSESGAFTLRVPEGRYALRPSSEQLLARGQETNGSAGAHADVSIEASLREPAPTEVVSWLQAHALPIATTDVPTESDRGKNNNDDLDALAKVLAGSRVIGIGEATHGTREYFRIKHRLLERLATHHGVTLLAMEANFSDAERVDAWVQTGKGGTVEDAMKGLFTVWRTEEVRDLLVWMRAWNADPKHASAKKKLRFRGYDVQGTRGSIAALRTYLRKVDTAAAENDLLGPLAALDADTNSRGMIDLGDDASAAKQMAGVTRLLERLAAARRNYVARSSAGDFELALHHARALEQALTRFAAKSPSEQFAARDRAMADNVVWLSEQIGKDERMMVWAHNGHIQLDSSTLLGANMGSRLREQLGRDYLAAGFVLDEGTYRAWVKPNEPTIVDVAIGPHEPGWTAEAFARVVGVPLFAVDLRGAPATGPVRDWLFSPHILHSCGWLVSEPDRKGGLTLLGQAFDVAIYAAHTTSARQLRKQP